MNNIYIYCLKKGYESKSGVIYNSLKSELIEKFDTTFSPDFELGFRIWFFDNFYEEEAEMNLEFERKQRFQLKVDRKTNYIPFERSTSKVVYLKGDATLKYLDYLELIEARTTSKRAFLFSIISIIIATMAIIIPLLKKTEIKQPVEVILKTDQYNPAQEITDQDTIKNIF